MSAAKGVSLRDKFARLYGYGHSLTAIAEAHHVGRETVIQLLTALGLKELQEVFPHAVPEPPPEQLRLARQRSELMDDRRPPVICFPDPSPRVWCVQCERLVTEACADVCASPFCKAKAQAA